ncbi:MAG: hypothetical protein KY055_02030 [Candidatus Nealsonbacteria bacterium]|nr:hypothetical protein [Candidatus Nealsonbacteria bacterium]
MEQIVIPPIISTILPVAFLISLVLGIIISIIFNYHWTRYGIGQEKIKKVRKIFFGVSFIFLTVMIVSIIIYFSLS